MGNQLIKPLNCVETPSDYIQDEYKRKIACGTDAVNEWCKTVFSGLDTIKIINLFSCLTNVFSTVSTKKERACAIIQYMESVGILWGENSFLIQAIEWMVSAMMYFKGCEPAAFEQILASTGAPSPNPSQSESSSVTEFDVRNSSSKRSTSTVDTSSFEEVKELIKHASPEAVKAASDQLQKVTDKMQQSTEDLTEEEKFQFLQTEFNKVIKQLPLHTQGPDPIAEPEEARGVLKMLGFKEVTLCPLAHIIISVAVAILAIVGGGAMMNWSTKQGKFTQWLTSLALFAKSIDWLKSGFKTFRGLITSFLVDVIGFTVADPEDDSRKAFLKDLHQCTIECEEYATKAENNCSIFFENAQKYAQILAWAEDMDKSFSTRNQDGHLKDHVGTLRRLVTAKERLKTFMRKMQDTCGQKVQPATIYIYGPAGHGKSELATAIAEALGEHHGRAMSTYTRQPGEEYWDNYNGQDVCIYDDYGQAQEDKDTFELFKIYTPAAYIVNKAALPEKGVMFSSKYLILCSNESHVQVSETTKNLDARMRRRDILLNVIDPRYEAGGENAHRVMFKFDHLQYTEYETTHDHEGNYRKIAEGKVSVENLAQRLYRIYCKNKAKFEMTLRKFNKRGNAVNFELKPGEIVNKMEPQPSETTSEVGYVKPDGPPTQDKIKVEEKIEELTEEQLADVEELVSKYSAKQFDDETVAAELQREQDEMDEMHGQNMGVLAEWPGDSEARQCVKDNVEWCHKKDIHYWTPLLIAELKDYFDDAEMMTAQCTHCSKHAPISAIFCHGCGTPITGFVPHKNETGGSSFITYDCYNTSTQLNQEQIQGLAQVHKVKFLTKVSKEAPVRCSCRAYGWKSQKTCWMCEDPYGDQQMRTGYYKPIALLGESHTGKTYTARECEFEILTPLDAIKEWENHKLGDTPRKICVNDFTIGSSTISAVTKLVQEVYDHPKEDFQLLLTGNWSNLVAYWRSKADDSQALFLNRVDMYIFKFRRRWNGLKHTYQSFLREPQHKVVSITKYQGGEAIALWDVKRAIAENAMFYREHDVRGEYEYFFHEPECIVRLDVTFDGMKKMGTNMLTYLMRAKSRGKVPYRELHRFLMSLGSVDTDKNSLTIEDQIARFNSMKLDFELPYTVLELKDGNYLFGKHKGYLAISILGDEYDTMSVEGSTAARDLRKKKVDERVALENNKQPSEDPLEKFVRNVTKTFEPLGDNSILAWKLTDAVLKIFHIAAGIYGMVAVVQIESERRVERNFLARFGNPERSPIFAYETAVQEQIEEDGETEDSDSDEPGGPLAPEGWGDDMDVVSMDEEDLEIDECYVLDSKSTKSRTHTTERSSSGYPDKHSPPTLRLEGKTQTKKNKKFFDAYEGAMSDMADYLCLESKPNRGGGKTQSKRSGKVKLQARAATLPEKERALRKVKGMHDRLSNLYPEEVTFEGEKYPSGEHLYQSMKCKELKKTEWLSEIEDLDSPMEVKKLSSKWSLTKEQRAQWRKVRKARMRQVMECRLQQQPSFSSELLATNTAQLIHNVADTYWGTGRDGKGMNVYGKMLMTLRQEFQTVTTQGSMDPNVCNIVPKIMKNIVVVGGTLGVMLNNTQGITVQHSFPYPRDELLLSFQNGVQVLAKVAKRHPTKDFLMFEIPEGSGAFRKITHLVWEEGRIEDPTNKEAVLCIRRNHINYAVLMQLRADKELQVVHRGTSTRKTGISYQTRMKSLSSPSMLTQTGDCGAPLILVDPSNTKKFCGIHTAANSYVGMSTPLTQADLHILGVSGLTSDVTVGEADQGAKGVKPAMEGRSQVETSSVVVTSQGPVEPDLTLLHHQKVQLHESPRTHRGFQQVGETVNEKGQVEKQHMSPRTELYLSPLTTTEIGEEFEPAILSRDDFRNPDNVDIYWSSVEKWNNKQPNCDIELVDRCFDTVAEWLADVVNNNQIPAVRKLTMKEAVNRVTAIPTSNPVYSKSSAGFPWKNEPHVKGKLPYFVKIKEKDAYIYKVDDKGPHGQKLMAAVQTLKRACSKKQKTCVCFQASLKDEARPKKKVRALKTRSFAGAPLDFTLLHRQYLHAAVAALSACRHDLPIKVGINGSNIEWDQLWKYLAKTGTMGFDGDMKNYDAHIPLCFFERLHRVYNRIYQENDPNWDKDDDIIREGILLHLCRPLLIVGEKVLMCPGGNVSGQPATAIDNCIFNIVYYFYTWMRLAQEHDPGKASFHDFRHYVSFAVYGDDNVCTVHPDVRDWFNFATYKAILETELNQEITAADKTETVIPLRPLHQLTFLKRGFKRVGPYVVGPLEDNCFAKMLQFTTMPRRHRWTENESIRFDPTTIRESMRSIILESSLKGKKFFEWIKQHLRKQCRKYNIEFDFPGTWVDTFKSTYFDDRS
ncbi:hypothetical protein 1 [Beihai sipunculid worm virus 5]|uniref:hypothetical protein 1 n=1 Tax=Beihai sipunculid worm virus 5 TaxID=1922677 RepID=UPI00090A8BD2|nr:hypothetical protein 1 [Beihai sipunculid worm virus 5]APG76865.1 hypothetical protein 1 [Beihai sipunculid worm virus 5]